MRWPMLAAGAALTLGMLGCEQIPIPFLSRGETADTATADTTTADTATVAQAAPDTQPTPPPRERPPERQPSRPLVDEPWTPIDTGTVRPGMTREEVIAVWGVPVAERQANNRTYLYFRNGCEVTCGTFDVVFLEQNQVVDAIVRGEGHHYAGVSSSPDEREAEFTPPPPEGNGGFHL